MHLYPFLVAFAIAAKQAIPAASAPVKIAFVYFAFDNEVFPITSEGKMTSGVQTEHTPAFTNFNNGQPFSLTAEFLTDMIFNQNFSGIPAGMNEVFKRASYGRVSFQGVLNKTAKADYFEFVRIPSSNTIAQNDDCHALYHDWILQADLALTNSLFKKESYNHVMYIGNADHATCLFSGITDLGSSAFGYAPLVPTTESFILLNSLNAHPLGNSFMAHLHEMGHSLGGWQHSGQLDCKNSTKAYVPFSSSCTARAYGDPSEIMSAHGAPIVSVFHRLMNGWIPAARVPLLIPLSTENFTLNTRDDNGILAPKGLMGIKYKLKTPVTISGFVLTHYFLDFGLGSTSRLFISNAPLKNGVWIRLTADTGTGSRLDWFSFRIWVDLTFVNATYIDVANKFSVKVLGMSANTCTVQVNLG